MSIMMVTGLRFLMQIATTADDATLKVWHIRRQQPEEQADDGTARQPWVYPWQQQQQVAAAAAAAAAYGSVGQLRCNETPLAAGPASASTAAATPRSYTPWDTGRRTGGNGGSSAAMLAALRSTDASAAPEAAASLAQNNAENCPPRHNVHDPPSLQQQQQAPGPAWAAEDGQERRQSAQQQQRQQQQQQDGDLVPASASMPRSMPWQTPFAARPAGATAAGRTPATAAGVGASASAGGRPAARRIADLLNAVPSTRRTSKQQSIASYLRSPAVGSEGKQAVARGAQRLARGESRSLRELGGQLKDA